MLTSTGITDDNFNSECQRYLDRELNEYLDSFSDDYEEEVNEEVEENNRIVEQATIMFKEKQDWLSYLVDKFGIDFMEELSRLFFEEHNINSEAFEQDEKMVLAFLETLRM